jgi:flagellar biogenesis protein FliO
MERAVKVYQIIFILWAIVFAMWLVRQFAKHNKDKERR